MIQVGTGLDKGAARLGHLGTVDGDKTVSVNRRGRAVFRCAQHGRPEQGVEVDDVLADKVVQLGAGILVPVFVEVQTGGLALFGIAQVLE